MIKRIVWLLVTAPLGCGSMFGGLVILYTIAYLCGVR